LRATRSDPVLSDTLDRLKAWAAAGLLPDSLFLLNAADGALCTEMPPTQIPPVIPREVARNMTFSQLWDAFKCTVGGGHRAVLGALLWTPPIWRHGCVRP
jgi:hypothetical protein